MRPSTDPVERRSHAREVARGALALVEAELVTPYDGRPGRGERLRVRRTLAGRAPARRRGGERSAPDALERSLQRLDSERKRVDHRRQNQARERER